MFRLLSLLFSIYAAGSPVVNPFLPFEMALGFRQVYTTVNDSVSGAIRISATVVGSNKTRIINTFDTAEITPNKP
jgi:hypothetical protein